MQRKIKITLISLILTLFVACFCAYSVTANSASSLSDGIAIQAVDDGISVYVDDAGTGGDAGTGTGSGETGAGSNTTVEPMVAWKIMLIVVGPTVVLAIALMIVKTIKGRKK